MRLLRCRYPFEKWRCSVCGSEQDRPPISVVAGLACEECLDRGQRGEPFVPLTVSPAKPRAQADVRPVVAVCVRERLVAVERTPATQGAGFLFELEELPARLRERGQGEQGGRRRYKQVPAQLPPAIVVTDRGVELTAFLDACPELTDHPLFNWQLGLRTHSAWRPEARSRSRFEFVVPRPVRFGFASQRGGKRRAKGRARWYQVIDVAMFCELPHGWGEPSASELLSFGVDLREWSNRWQLPILASASAYGSRLLRDARFGGGWKRKVPAATNAAVRPLLPGNHYQLLGAAGLAYPVVHKLDQQRAHHHAAFVTRFPDPNHLRAHGHWRQPAPRDGVPMGSRGPIPAGSELWRELTAQAGVFIGAVSVPERVALDNLHIPALRKPGARWRTFTSVELAHLHSLEREGVRLLDLWCCWTSPEDDDRIREYAFWSGQQLDRATPRIKRWLKPTLLAAYGMLAVRPARFRSAWKWAAHPDGAIGWQTAFGTLVGLEKSGRRERESTTANVIWRALIESQVRLESLQHAQRLRGGGFRPISVYADAVFATGRGEPPAPFPWRYEGVLEDLCFETPSRYRSSSEVRLPGTPTSERTGLKPAHPNHQEARR